MKILHMRMNRKSLINDYFATIGSSLSNKITTNNVLPYENYLDNSTEHIFSFTRVTEQTTLDMINNLPNKRSCGNDNISNQFFLFSDR